MIYQFFLLGIRNIYKNKVFSVINILGLAAGMAAVLIIFLWVKDELSYEQYHEKKNQVALAYLMVTAGDDSEWKQAGYQATTAPAVAGELASRYPEVLQTARGGDLGETVFRKDDDAVIESGGLATEPSVFDILTFRFLQGSSGTALSQPYSIVLTEKLVKKYFSGMDPVGKSLQLNNNHIFTVTGVISDMPENAYRRYDFLVPFSYLEELGDDIRSTSLFYPCSYYTYVLLEEGSNLDSLNAKLGRDIFFAGQEARGKIGFVNLRNVYLTETGGSMRIYIFIVIAVVILLIACMNYTNLAAASAVGRLKEIFTRKVNGAEKKQLAGQFYGESFVLSLIAMLVGIGFILWFLPHFNQITSKHISFQLFDLPTLLAVLIILFMTSVIAGIYPAILLSNIRMRGPADLFPQTSGGKRHFQKILLFFQLTITVIFIISSIIIYRQSDYIRGLNAGMNKHNVFYSRLDESALSRISVLKNELLINPDILSVSVGSNLPNNISVGSFFQWGLPELPDSRIVYGAADYDYLKTFDIELARGRFFSPEYPSDSVDAIVVNEAAMKKIGRDIPVDSLFYFGSINLKLIGVMKDFRHTTPLNTDIQPLCLLHLSNPLFRYFYINNRYLFVKIDPAVSDRDRITEINEYVNATGKKLSPGYPLDFRFLDTFTFAADRSLESWRRLVLYSSLLAIVITCMGLLALTSLNTSQRTREIGIHKVNGARLSDIILKFYRSFVFWIGLANLIAWPLAWVLMKKFLQGFANQTPISWWIFPVAGALSVLILMATITWHIYHIAKQNPSESLKYE